MLLLVLAAALVIWQFAVAAGWLRAPVVLLLSRLASSAIELAVGVPVGKTLLQHARRDARARASPRRGLSPHSARPADRLATVARSRRPQPIVGFCRSAATLSLLPLALTWFGVGEASNIFLIGYGCFWVMLSNVVAAVRLVCFCCARR